MKKVIIITAAALLFSIGAMAQFPGGGPGGPGGGMPDEAQMAEMRTQWMARQLGLDEAQTAKVLELNKKYPMSMMRPGGGPGMGRPSRNPQEEQKVEADPNADPKAAKKAAKKAKKAKKQEEQAKAADDAQATMEAYENELKEILTEDQFKTYQENKNRRPQGRGPGGPGGRPGGFGGPGGGPGGFGGPGGGPGGF